MPDDAVPAPRPVPAPMPHADQPHPGLSRHGATRPGAFTLTHLRALDAVARTGSISLASADLGLAQPTVSATLTRLERLVGADLLVRTAHGTTLTAAGQFALDTALPVLSAMDTFGELVASLRPRSPAEGRGLGTLRVAASLTIAENLLPVWLAACPARTEMTVRNSLRVQELVLTGEVDLGFVEGPAVRDGLWQRTVARDELVLVAAPDHRWAGRETPVTPAELVGSGLVTREEGSGTYDVLARALRHAGVVLPTAVARLGSTAAVLTAVRRAGAVAVVSELAVACELASGTLVTVPVTGLDLHRRLRAVRAQGREPSREARALLEVLPALT